MWKALTLQRSAEIQSVQVVHWRVVLLLLDSVDTADGYNGSPESAACIDSFSVDWKQTFGPKVTCRYPQSRQPHLKLCVHTVLLIPELQTSPWCAPCQSITKASIWKRWLPKNNLQFPGNNISLMFKTTPSTLFHTVRMQKVSGNWVLSWNVFWRVFSQNIPSQKSSMYKCIYKCLPPCKRETFCPPCLFYKWLLLTLLWWIS